MYGRIYTGFRISEFLGLTPASVREVDGIKVLIGGMKTEAGKNRTVPIHPRIADIVSAPVKKDGKTLFCRDDGTPMPPKYFREKCYIPALNSIGVRPLNPHATRRTFSTMMSAAGVREEDMIALMGHADFSVDVDHYIRQSAKTLSEAINKIG